MTRCVFIDFETQSDQDIRKVGGSVYAESPATRVLCAAIYDPNCGDLVRKPQNPVLGLTQEHKTILRDIALDPGVIFVAHNVSFERAIWGAKLESLGILMPPVERWKCTLAQAAACGMPQGLEECSLALGHRAKHDKGYTLMLKMCKAGFDESEMTLEQVHTLYDYCAFDTHLSHFLFKTLPPLGQRETRVWMMDQRINERGLPVDQGMCRDIAKFVARHKESLTTRCDLNARSQKQVLDALRTAGYDISDLRPESINDLLATFPEQHIVDLLKLRAEVTRSSVKKFDAIAATCSGDGRVRNTLRYHSASTGRWGGRGCQPQNFPGTTDGSMELVRFIQTNGPETLPFFYEEPMKNLGSCVKLMIKAPKKTRIFGGDFSQIEARVRAWLAGDEELLQNFREGTDLYCATATKLFGRTITKADVQERQTGKIQELALGFQGGIAALSKMKAKFGITLAGLAPAIEAAMPMAHIQEAREYMSFLRYDPEDPEAYVAALLVKGWRASNPKIVKLWGDLLQAFNAGAASGKIQYRVFGGSGAPPSWGAFCLPSGRPLWYYKPGSYDAKPGYLGLDKTKKQMVPEQTYGGKLCENIVQAIARDCMVEQMFRLEDAGFEIFLTCHDSIAALGDEDRGLEEFTEIMERPIEWIPGLPLKAECYKSDRLIK